MKKNRNILNFLALNRFIAKNTDFIPDDGSMFNKGQALNVSNETLIGFFRCLEQQKIKFLTSGGVAAAYYGYIKPVTKIEIWLGAQKDNINRFFELLGDAQNDNAVVVYTDPETRESFKLLIYNNTCCFDANDFDWCYAKRSKAILSNVTIPILCLEHLLAEMVASGKAEDKKGIEELEKIQNLSVD